MDIPRKESRSSRHVMLGVGILLLIALISAAYMRFVAASDSTYVDRRSLVISDAVRADLVREVRAPGNLVPAELRWVAATSNARVKDTILDPGDAVTPDSIVMTLTNPDLEQALDSATLELEVLEAEYRALEQRLANEKLTQESVVAEMEARYELADFRKSANQTLAEDKAVSLLSLNESFLEEKQLKIRAGIERRRLDSLTGLHEAELAAKRARINQSARELELRQQLFDELTVRAQFTGHLQDVPVEQGQQVAIGTILARVADNENLKVELRVQESQVKDVLPGQSVEISAGGNHALATVRRVEPEVQEGVVLVDVVFSDAMLTGARSDLRVDGVIELEKLEDTLKIKRPVFSQENASLNLFVVSADGLTAVKRAVRVGKASTDEIEILEGLSEGEKVIVSDTSQYNQIDLLTLR